MEQVLVECGEGSRYPVVSNLCGAMWRTWLALGVEELDEIGERITEMLDLKVPEGLMGKLSMLPKLDELGLKNGDLFAYQITGGSNRELPDEAFSTDGRAHSLARDIYPNYDIVLCISTYSATAPLTALAKKIGFRGAPLHGGRAAGALGREGWGGARWPVSPAKGGAHRAAPLRASGPRQRGSAAPRYDGQRGAHPHRREWWE